MQSRALVLPLAALVISALVAYKVTRTYPDQPPAGAAPTAQRLAPRFWLMDQHSKGGKSVVKFDRYLGRHVVLVVFFDGLAGAGSDPHLLRLREEYPRIEAAGAVVVGISTALPQQNRQAAARSGPFPFPLLSDLDYAVHRQWWGPDATPGQPRQGVFLVDRAGQVAWSNGRYQPLDDLQQAIGEILHER